MIKVHLLAILLVSTIIGQPISQDKIDYPNEDDGISQITQMKNDAAAGYEAPIDGSQEPITQNKVEETCGASGESCGDDVSFGNVPSSISQTRNEDSSNYVQPSPISQDKVEDECSGSSCNNPPIDTPKIEDNTNNVDDSGTPITQNRIDNVCGEDGGGNGGNGCKSTRRGGGTIKAAIHVNISRKILIVQLINLY